MALTLNPVPVRSVLGDVSNSENIAPMDMLKKVKQLKPLVEDNDDSMIVEMVKYNWHTLI